MSKIAVSDIKKISVHDRLSHLEAINVVGGASKVKSVELTLKVTFETK